MRPWTPGPWTVMAEIASSFSGGEARVAGAMLSSETKAFSVKTTSKDVRGFRTVADILSQEAREHNARLIASAPELYEALDRLVTLVVAGGISPEDMDDALEQADQVLAKANSTKGAAL